MCAAVGAGGAAFDGPEEDLILGLAGAEAGLPA